MPAFLGRFGDRLLTKFVPGHTAQAVKCQCYCTDKCWPCCPAVVDGVPTTVCYKDQDCNP